MKEQKKYTAPVETELCQSESHTFYTDINGKMVYISVIVQDIPKRVKSRNSSYRSVGEYLKNLSCFIDELFV